MQILGSPINDLLQNAFYYSSEVVKHAHDRTATQLASEICEADSLQQFEVSCWLHVGLCHIIVPLFCPGVYILSDQTLNQSEMKKLKFRS